MTIFVKSDGILAFSQSWDKRNSSSITQYWDNKRSILLVNELSKMASKEERNDSSSSYSY